MISDNPKAQAFGDNLAQSGLRDDYGTSVIEQITETMSGESDARRLQAAFHLGLSQGGATAHDLFHEQLIATDEALSTAADALHATIERLSKEGDPYHMVDSLVDARNVYVRHTHRRVESLMASVQGALISLAGLVRCPNPGCPLHIKSLQNGTCAAFAAATIAGITDFTFSDLNSGRLQGRLVSEVAKPHLRKLANPATMAHVLTEYPRWFQGVLDSLSKDFHARVRQSTPPSGFIPGPAISAAARQSLLDVLRIPEDQLSILEIF